LKGYFTELEKILSNNTSPVWVIRAIIRYYINAYIVLSKMKEGSNIDEAIASLSPPIFFKYVMPFKQAVSKITIKDILACLEILYEAEKSIKSGSFSPKQICDQIFPKILKKDKGDEPEGCMLAFIGFMALRLLIYYHNLA
jgi:DNA polymerase-3 subunit delta